MQTMDVLHVALHVPSWAETWDTNAQTGNQVFSLGPQHNCCISLKGFNSRRIKRGFQGLPKVGRRPVRQLPMGALDFLPLGRPGFFAC